LNSPQDKLQKLDTLLPLPKQARAQGKKIAFTNGCFDLLHVGHIRYLQEARSFGDLLVIAVNTDKTVGDLKGDGRPVVPASERMEVLAAFEFCDYVFEFFEPTPIEVLTLILPDVLVKGGDWSADQIVGRELVEANGGKVERITFTKGRSTTNVIEKILSFR